MMNDEINNGAGLIIGGLNLLLCNYAIKMYFGKNNKIQKVH